MDAIFIGGNHSFHQKFCVRAQTPLPMRSIYPILLPMLVSSLLHAGVTGGGNQTVTRSDLLSALEPGIYARIDTGRGSILAELFFEEAPLTVANFVGLAEGSLGPATEQAPRPFYDGLTFHRVVPGFVVQGGDPKGTGEGGPGYTFPDEFSPALQHGQAGILSMANEGPDTNGSQFFITLDDRQDRLNYKHSVFGKVIQGMDLVRSIREGDRIRTITILRKGETAEAFETSRESWDRRLAEFAPIPEYPAPLPYFIHSAELVLPGWFPQWFAEKLYHYEAVRGIRIWVRVFQRFEPAMEGDTPERWVERWVSMLGWKSGVTRPRWVAVCYFVETDQWVVQASPGLWAALFSQNSNDPTNTLLAEAARYFSEPTPRRLIDGMATAIMLRLDQRP